MKPPEGVPLDQSVLTEIISDAVMTIITVGAPLLLAALIIGVVMGGLATWITQRRWRRIARTRAADAARWRAEADRLSRERDANRAAAARKSADATASSKQLALTDH